MDKVKNVIYEYLNEPDDAEECLKRLDELVVFVIEMRHSYVDCDKPRSMSRVDVDMMILRKAVAADLSVVDLDGKQIIFRER